MNRLELIRDLVDQIISKINNETMKRNAYVHTYGVCYLSSIYANRLNLDEELLCIMAMLHDIAKYKDNVGHKDHALKSAIIAKELLTNTNSFTNDEIQLITNAISLHSHKYLKHDDCYTEALKDCDILASYLYDKNITIPQQNKHRLYYALEKINLK